MSLSNNFPTVSPTLNLNFAAAGRLDSRVTFTRSSTATYTNQIGLIQSAAVNEPRFDYNPSTLAARGLLIEESRTNLLLYSEQFDNAAWIVQDSSTTANSAAAPDGTNSAEKIIPNTNNAEKAVYNGTGITLAASAHTWSVFAKAAGYNFASLIAVSPNGVARYAITASLIDGSVTQTASSGTPSGTSYAVTAYANGWYRLSITMNASATAGASYLVFSAASTGTPTRNATSLDVTFTGDGTSGALFWGAQLEAGSFATSYIPTVAATVTRSADVASVNTLSPWYSSTAGSMLVEFSTNIGTSGTTFAGAAAITDSGFANVVATFGVNNSGSKLQFEQYTSSDLRTFFDPSLATRTNIKAAAGWDSAGASFSFNGGAASTATTAIALATVDRLRLGTERTGNALLNGYLRRVTYYSARLTNAQLVALTL